MCTGMVSLRPCMCVCLCVCVTAAAELSDVSEALTVLPHVYTRALVDVGMQYRLTNGQVST